MLSTHTLFGLQLVDADPQTALNTMLDRRGRSTTAFVNAHCVNVAATDKAYRRALRAADFVLPDGAGMSIAAKLTGRRFTANLNGTDLSRPLAREAARRGLSLYLLGGRPGVAEKAGANLQKAVPGLKIAGTRDGFFDQTASEGGDIRGERKRRRHCHCALGVPLQENWLYTHRRQLEARLALGVGALLDFEAGIVPRAPRALRNTGMEWAWRLAQEPRRLARRYILGNPAFLARAAVNALRSPRPARSAMPLAKRALDLIVAATALTALAPVVAGTALAVKATSRGPVFFRQTRVGLNGQTFRMIKFRSMHVDAEARKAAFAAHSERQGVCFKMKHDPRLTPIGAMIRRYSLDELPQLFQRAEGGDVDRRAAPRSAR